jgi:hypothetical protein
MSRESESHLTPTPALGWRSTALARLPAFASTRRGKATLVICAAALMGAGTLSTASYMGADVAAQIAKKGQSFLSLMKQRSPGARTGDMLIKTKGRKYAVLAASVPAPQSAALPASAPGENPPIEFAPGVAPVSELAQLGPIFAPPLGGGTFFTPPGGGGGPTPDCCSIGPPGPVPSGPPGPPGPPPPPPPPPPGVPEPATWAMMLVGFLSTGWSIRRRRARDLRISACA